jgi:hypothetical protein
MFKEAITDKNRRLRIFTDTDCTEQLKVWYNDGAEMDHPESVSEFRLVYDLTDDAHCIIWRKKGAEKNTGEIYAHVGVDDGEDKCIIDRDGNRVNFSPKQAPTLVLNGVFERKHLVQLADNFMSRTKNIDQKLAKFIYEKLLAFPEDQFVSAPHK